ncbi:MAG: hypothetical protein WCE20_16075 [Rhizomicrobium sp.]
MERAPSTHPGSDRICQVNDFVVAEHGFGSAPEIFVLRDLIRGQAHSLGIANGQALALTELGIVFPVQNVAVEFLIRCRTVGVDGIVEITVKHIEHAREITPATHVLADVAAID